MRKHVLLLGALVPLLVSSMAEAYTHRRTQGGTDVRWQVDHIQVTADASLAKLDPDPAGLASRALSTWIAAKGASLPPISVVAGAADDIGYRQGDTNSSTVRYMPDGWKPAGHALGVTVVTSDDAGEILDADIVLNGGESRPFGEMSDTSSTDGSSSSDSSSDDEKSGRKNVYDVLNVLTHESGHFFGLGESPDFPDAAMFPTSGRGETKKRHLSADDVSGIATLYVPGSEAKAATAGCALSSGDAHESRGLAITAALVLAAALLRKRKLAAGATTLAIGAAFFFAAPSTSHASAPSVLVAEAATRWENGLAVTRLDLVEPGGARRSIEVLGGTKDGLTQVIGHHEAPHRGAVLRASFEGSRLVVRDLPVRFDAEEL